MKLKSLFFAFGLSVLMLSGLSGCVASAGPGYGYYPPAPSVYYPPRPVVVVPAPYYRRPVYRPAPRAIYRAPYSNYRHDAYRGGSYGGNYRGGSYGGRRGGRY